MKPDSQPYCGEELLPHATAPDDTPAPLTCTLPAHPRHVKHRNAEHATEWHWQDANGNRLSRPATDVPA